MELYSVRTKLLRHIADMFSWISKQIPGPEVPRVERSAFQSAAGGHSEQASDRPSTQARQWTLAVRRNVLDRGAKYPL
ncbi:putative Zn finger protein [Anopheles sinensis]|uniref:Putative Zn finger protein n=1 Tax=Anopheles sinensis TaxID=74873 RepID=A0A084WFA1_ANOSI|nr:putative Zn finger protein [Anopheles sinensis]